MASVSEQLQRRWFDLRGPGIVAVSGGADSVALLRCLVDWVKPLAVAHLNHRLRGADSDGDEHFVRELAGSLSLPFHTIALDIKGESSRGGTNLEDTARRARYDWLTQVARETGAAWIATGHTANDQAETVLHRLIRGAGIQGLRGIALRRELTPGIELIRPLLEVGRSQIVEYLQSIGQAWREDMSNRDPAFTRNRIRHEVLPMLRTFNPAIVDVLGRLAEQAREIHVEQEQGARAFLNEVELPRAGSLCIIQLEKLKTASRHRIRGMFRLLWEREAWPMRDMTFEHWKRLVGVALGEESVVELPGGIWGRRKGSVLQVGR